MASPTKNQPRSGAVFPIENSTKIVATLGPSSSNPEQILRLISAGADVFRLNFSHGSEEDHGKVIKSIRAMSKECGRYIGIIADLQGPKIRLGKIKGQKLTLEKDSEIKLVTSTIQELGDRNALTTGTPHADLCVRHIAVGEKILINDGSVEALVIERYSLNEVLLRIVVGGEVSERQGLNIPKIDVHIDPLTDKDRKDALFALSQGVDFIAMSFIQHGDEVTSLRDFLKTNAKPGQQIPKIISKIEKPNAISNIDSIIGVSDCLMIARGDLSVECSFEKVPSYQKMLIQKCQKARIPVITATQMLHSMISNATPTRAEVSDVANAVYDGSDAVMLSGETAMGQYPFEACEAMAKIIQEAEAMTRAFQPQLLTDHLQRISRPPSEENGSSFDNHLEEGEAETMYRYDHAIAVAAVSAAWNQKCSALLVVCNSYELGVYFSKLRPPCPLIVITFDQTIANLLSLSFGCYCLVMDDPNQNPFFSSDSFMTSIEEKILRRKWLREGDLLVFCSCGTDSPLKHLPLLRHTLQLTRFGQHLPSALEKKKNTAPESFLAGVRSYSTMPSRAHRRLSLHSSPLRAVSSLRLPSHSAPKRLLSHLPPRPPLLRLLTISSAALLVSAFSI